MRVLVATTAGAGHFGPMIPFARALADAGHDVVITAPASFASVVERAGFVHQPFADASPEELGAVFSTLRDVTNDEGNSIVIREVFGRIDTRAALPGVRALVDQWRPDLVLRDTSELASYVVAEAAGIRHVQVSAGLASFEERFLPELEDPLSEVGCTAGVEGLLAAPRLTLVPESLESPAPSSARTTGRFRDEAAPAPGALLPDWWAGDGAPLVYVSFGSVAAALGLYPGLYRDVAAALAEMPLRVLLTSGDAGDPDLIGPLPANVHVETWWPQQDVMPHAAAMVGHGGFGTTILGLAAGVPMVVLPLFADQPHNAARVHDIGAGIAVDGGSAGVGALPAALRRVLDEPSFREQAERLAADIAALPPASEAVPLLEQLAR